MAEINCILSSKSFLVPSEVVEQYLNECNEYQLKLLLLLLENPRLTEEELAKKLSLTVHEVELGFKFWLARGLLEKKEKQKIKAEFLNLKLTTKELTQILNESKELKFIIEQLPAILGRLPNQFDMLNVIDFNLNLGMQPELILYLLKYCATVGKSSAQAIKNQARIWFEIGINSLELVEEYIKRVNKANELQTFVKTELHIKTLTNVQKAVIESWQTEMEFGQALIKEACTLAKLQKEKANVHYVNGILNNWYKDGIKTVKDLDTKQNTVRNFKTGKAKFRSHKNEPEFSSLSQDDINKL
ncbi:MAG: DnaD domain protein [Oscillospiraceae bacterium]